MIGVSFAVLQEGMGTGWFWLLTGTFFVCGASSTGIVQQHFIPFCADNNVAPVRAASFLAVMGVFNFTGTIAVRPGCPTASTIACCWLGITGCAACR